ncbi:hypothetical protein JCM9492_11430 [Aquifex pyrophilus]
MLSVLSFTLRAWFIPEIEIEIACGDEEFCQVVAKAVYGDGGLKKLEIHYTDLAEFGISDGEVLKLVKELEKEAVAILERAKEDLKRLNKKVEGSKR